MALSRFLKGSGNRSREADKAEQPEPARQHGPTGLAAILQQGVVLQPERIAMLEEGLKTGLEFFEQFNESRLQLAFGSFDEEMRKALFEVMFLLHVNDPKLAGFAFTATDVERVGGAVRYKPRETEMDLYVEGAPYGVEGIGELSPVFRDAFHAHVRETFDTDVPSGSAFGYCPIKSLHSLGSIGTVGHKSRASDLDLQVQYELEPFLFDPATWSDQTFRDALNAEARLAAQRLRAQQRLSQSALQDPKVRSRLQQGALQQVAKAYPLLHAYLVTRERDYGKELVGEAGHQTRTQTLHEIVALMKRSVRLSRGEELKRQEELLRERLRRIQEYVQLKYPMAEIYLFTCSNDDYRRGHHGSTLQNKEASGSAYELILNYDTLMPGIQITPMVPAHFVLPKVINDDPGLYERIVDYIRFGLVKSYDTVRDRLVNLGATPDLTLDYVAKHSGAVYWEAFKASSGNLPKAILNLFRYECLLDDRFRKTIIQHIKDPQYMNQFAAAKPEDPQPDLDALVAGETGLPPWALVDMEEQFPLLKQDPWWLRYKALKVAYHEPEGLPGIERVERNLISKIIDQAFALHVRLSDVFTKPGDTRPFDSFREQVLLEYLKRAFPPISPRRQFLEHLFIGEVRSVNQFEREMRVLFKRCLARVNKKIASLNIQGQSNQKEFEIWYHYYQENFEPGPNVIPRTILKHLMVPRGRLQIGHKLGEGWFFRSEQKESRVGKRFDTFGYLDHLPQEVMLREKSTFVMGLADCVLNGYYGILNQGTLKETRTVIEFDARAMDLGNRIDNTMAFLRPDNVHRIFNRIIEFFPARPYHYMDCVEDPRRVVELIVFLNAFKFGRMSFLYRDNLLTWYCDEFDHKELFTQAQKYHHAPRAMFTAKPLHVTLARFFKGKQINPAEIALDAWVNPNSVVTNHSSQQLALKEKELSEALRGLILQVHAPKPPEGAEAPAAGDGSGATAGQGATKPADEGDATAGSAEPEGEAPSAGQAAEA